MASFRWYIFFFFLFQATYLQLIIFAIERLSGRDSNSNNKRHRSERKSFLPLNYLNRRHLEFQCKFSNAFIVIVHCLFVFYFICSIIIRAIICVLMFWSSVLDMNMQKGFGGGCCNKQSLINIIKCDSLVCSFVCLLCHCFHLSWNEFGLEVLAMQLILALTHSSYIFIKSIITLTIKQNRIVRMSASKVNGAAWNE